MSLLDLLCSSLAGIRRYDERTVVAYMTELRRIRMYIYLAYSIVSWHASKRLCIRVMFLLSNSPSNA